MLNLFSTLTNKPGYRLQYMEVYNWGTFNDRIFKIEPKGNNSLLTGANASGKSTFIDALLTLLVPAKKDRFYNQSSGVEKKGDRTEETYVLGNYATIQRDGDLGTLTKSLRDKNCFSILLANFQNAEEKSITVFQVRWYSNDELKRSFGIAHLPLNIERDFQHFDQKGNWKKTLDKRYNSNTTKKKIEFMDGPIAYADRLADLFGMRSKKALSLFNQVVGVKVLEDLDEFIRTNMLEELDAESEFLALKDSFNTLMEAKVNIEKVKDQLKYLEPINDFSIKIADYTAQLKTLYHSKETSVFWFAKKGLELANNELIKTTNQFDLLHQELNLLHEKETKLKDQETNLTVQIKSDQIGNQVEQLKNEISQLEKNIQNQQEKRTNYNIICRLFNLSENPDLALFNQNKSDSLLLKESINQEIDKLNDELRNEKNRLEKIISEQKEIEKTLDFLAKNKNNITGNIATIRDEIVQVCHSSKDEIPFVAELIKTNNQTFQPAIEKILHQFAHQIIVPEKYTEKVKNYLTENNYDAISTILTYKGFTSLDGLKIETNENHFVHQLDLKTESIYSKWIKDIIEQKFDLICVEKIIENQNCLLENGFIIYQNGNLVKDNRVQFSKKENYILGWENTQKVKVFYDDIKLLKKQAEESELQIEQIKIRISEQQKQNEAIFNLQNSFEKFELIDDSSFVTDLENKQRFIEIISSENDSTEDLQNELNRIKTELKELSQKEINDKNREIFKLETLLQQIKNEIKRNEDLISQNKNIEIEQFETIHPDLLHIDYYSIKLKQTEFQKELETQIKSLEYSKRLTEDKIKQKINEFKNPKEEIITKYKDWRSDVSTLPDSIHIELISEYQDFYLKLSDENLPRFETKFEAYLQETIINKIGDFRMFFENWSDDILENISSLNESLSEIDYNTKEYTTYIQLVGSKLHNQEILEFKNLLNRAISIGNESLLLFEEKRDHFNENIAPLIKKLSKEDWRNKVMDVRYWFNYKAEEFRRDTNEKEKTHEHMGALSGGEKAQLTYTILGAAIAYQFNLTNNQKHNGFRFIAIDEAFKAQDEDKARYLLRLCKQLNLQLLVVTPSDNIHIVENDISFVHYVERKEEKYSWLYDMPIAQYQSQKELFDAFA